MVRFESLPGPEKGVLKMVLKMDPQKNEKMDPEGADRAIFGGAWRNGRWHWGGKEG